MTHTSTEQPEALRLADWLDQNSAGIYRPAAEAAAEIRRLHDRVQELEAQTAHMADLVELADYATKKLEASQAQRVPLTDAQIKEGRNAVNDDPDDRPEPWAFREGVKFAERMHGITQEKQG